MLKLRFFGTISWAFTLTAALLAFVYLAKVLFGYSRDIGKQLDYLQRKVPPQS